MKRTAKSSTDELSEDKLPDRVRRVFQSLEYQTDPVTGQLKFQGTSQYVTYVSRGKVDANLGLMEPPQTHVIDRSGAGQFILRENAPHYYEQLESLRRICRTRPNGLVEVAMDKENIPPVLPLAKGESVSDRKLRELEEERTKYLKELGELGDAVSDKDKRIEELEDELQQLKEGAKGT